MASVRARIVVLADIMTSGIDPMVEDSWLKIGTCRGFSSPLSSSSWVVELMSSVVVLGLHMTERSVQIEALCKC